MVLWLLFAASNRFWEIIADFCVYLKPRGRFGGFGGRVSNLFGNHVSVIRVAGASVA